ncbi:hypothetical protein ZYGR_0AV02140 [Zygosaccharomyces rouxii]|uniref:Uncharacterized protein n=1 Tax=Zygosaccharomyces rouxii TaxID=4956 RepID=A0A1Q3AJ00_ZYGRO|nr:hypothetical protein ZYGR_0AV02140 [Zygosaccharomyces rouxii]
MDRSLLINVASLITSSYGLFRCTQIKLPPSLAQAGQKQFLTNISLAATISHNVVTIATHVAKRIKGHRAEKERREKAFARATASAEEVQYHKREKSQEQLQQQNNSVDSNNCVCSLLTLINKHVTLPLALVLESVVATVYWPLRLFAIGLILQGAKKRSPIPLHIDISIHLLPILYMLSDYYLSGAYERFKIGLLPSWGIIAAIGLAYKSYLNALIDTSTNQKYPYPFLDVSEPYKSIIFVVITSFGWLFYVGYRALPPKGIVSGKERTKLD